MSTIVNNFKRYRFIGIADTFNSIVAIINNFWFIVPVQHRTSRTCNQFRIELEDICVEM